MADNLMQKSVGTLVVEQPSRSRVFEEFGIDYCCGGKRRLDEACDLAGASPSSVVAALANADQARGTSREGDWAEESMSALIDHILSAHHAYLRRELPRLSELAAKVACAHGARFPWVVECQRVLGDLRAELESHMLKEERILFPLIEQLAGASESPAFHCGSILNPISVMEHEHDNANDALAQMCQLSNGFVPPADACNTLRAWLDGLSELEADLHQHIHEENNILFPKAQALEAKLAGIS